MYSDKRGGAEEAREDRNLPSLLLFLSTGAPGAIDFLFLNSDNFHLVTGIAITVHSIN